MKNTIARISVACATGGSIAVLLLAVDSGTWAAESTAPPTRPLPGQSQATTAVTPVLADGHPDLSGYWRAGGGYGGGGGGATPPEGDAFAVMGARNGRLQNLENDSYISQKALQNVPQYKPEYWGRVRELDLNGNKEDPTFNCLPAGVPRAGPPVRVISLPGEVVFFHMTGNPAATYFRFIQIGRKRTRADLTTETWQGVPEARWEGDTLVIDSIGFNDQSWLGWGGYFHTSDMHVVERYRREGDILHYSAIVEDPAVLTEPWRPDPVDLRLDRNPNNTISEVDPCIERDNADIVNNIRG